MVGVIYGLCALTALLCAGLLLKAYRRNRNRLLLWSGLCFVVLTLNNLILILDKVIIPSNDLSTWRLVTALSAITVLLYGLIWNTE